MAIVQRLVPVVLHLQDTKLQHGRLIRHSRRLRQLAPVRGAYGTVR